MATHTIKCPDWSRGDEPRRIVWDDAAGEVSGDHVEVPAIRNALERAARNGHLMGVGGCLDVRDPRHAAADFLTVLGVCIGGTFNFARVHLPPTLRGVTPTLGQGPPHEEGVLY